MIITTVTLRPDALTGHAIANKSIRRACDSDAVLWARTRRDELTIVSDISPEWELIPGAVNASSQKVTAYKRGERITWRILAAPVKRVSPRDSTGRTVGKVQKKAMPEAEVLPWLRKQVSSGMDVTEAALSRIHTSTEFGGRWLIRGRGVVTDGEALRDVVISGLGTLRAQGCGLLYVETD